MDEEPLAYKFIGSKWTWLVTEYDDEDIPEMQPMYALIEDEE